MDAAADLATVTEVLSRYQFAHQSEVQLQDGIAAVLAEHGITVEPEVRLTPRDRVDFLTPTGIGIEVKAKRGWPAASLVRQLLRYVASDQVTALLVVTTDPRHGAVPAELGGKPVHVHIVRGALA